MEPVRIIETKSARDDCIIVTYERRELWAGARSASQ
jgi:hypothetical protein